MLNPNWILKKLNCTFSSLLKLRFLLLGSPTVHRRLMLHLKFSVDCFSVLVSSDTAVLPVVTSELFPLSVSVSGGSGESTQPFAAPTPLPVSAGGSGESVYPSAASMLSPAAPPPAASMPPPAQPPARPPAAAMLSPCSAPSPPEVSASAHPAWPLDLLCLGRRHFPSCRPLNCSLAATFHVVGPLNYVACGSPLESIVSARGLPTNLLNSVWF